MSENMKAVLDELGVTADFEPGARKPPADPSWHPAQSWTVTLHNGRRRMVVDFYGGSAVRVQVADVISSLCLDTQVGEQSFEDYCSDFGIDPDSRKAEATWRACRKIAPKLRAFLGDDFDRVCSAEW